MSAGDSRIDFPSALDRDRARLLRDSRFRWYHWLAILLSGLLTLYAWDSARSADDTRAARRFERESERTMDLFVDRLRRYEDVLWASVAKVSANQGRISREDWQRYTDRLDFLSEFPATSGLGVVSYVPRERLPAFMAEQRQIRPDFTLRPEQDAPFHMPVTFVVPSSLESKAPGLDLVHNDARREAGLAAGQTNTVRITSPVLPTASPDVGFVMFAPFYRSAETAEPEAALNRLQRLEGWIGASVVGTELADGLLDTSRRSIHVAIDDDGVVLFDERDPTRLDVDPEPMFSTALDLAMYGRTWRFEMQSGLAFRREASTRIPEGVLAGGLLIDTLLILMFSAGTRRNRLTLRLVDARRDRLSARTSELEQINEELQSFSYIVSHDLKTPLRGIGMITEFIEEDLEQTEPNQIPSAEIQDHAVRLDESVDRANALINGVMSYFHVGGKQESCTECDVRSLLEGIGQTLLVDEGQLRLEGEFPEIRTHCTQLEQVLTNLVGNAFKYHDDPAHAIVRVRVEQSEHELVFTVEDDGPGIDERFHEKIFELFGTLDIRRGADSTGVGLAIVKRTIERMGGGITVESSPEQGAKFTFSWPVRSDSALDEKSVDLLKAA